MANSHLRKVRIGAGAGYSGDRFQPALDLIEGGNLDYVVFECLAERTIALAQQRKAHQPDSGYDPMLESRMRKVLSACSRSGTRLISNMGAANPIAAVAKTREIAEELGLSGLKIAAITGDDILAFVRSEAGSKNNIIETGLPVSSLGENLISANAYIGSAPIVEALQKGSHIILGGRIADPALFLAPLMHEFGWQPDDWELLGRGILVGHLLECAGQLSGGYFADPPYKNVQGLGNLGFPFADVTSDGAAEFSKLEASGGEITLMTCKEQLFYEVHDPKAYLTPDVTADFSDVELRQIVADRVAAHGATGTVRPDKLKASLGCMEGYIGEGQITYAGAGAQDRARLAIEIVCEQLRLGGCRMEDLRCELIGINSVYRGPLPSHETPEVRVRIAAKTQRIEDARLVADVVEALYTNGPAGGGGASKAVRPVIGIVSALIPREIVSTQVSYEISK